MLQNRNSLGATHLALAALVTIGIGQANAYETGLASSPPERCTGYGNLQSVSLTDWESGLGTWSTGSYGIINPATFDTPDWAVAGNLPDARAGMAAFVPNLDISLCGPDDETGALTLDSPPILIPSGTQVPRISIDHWFDIESDWDGGNLKIKIGGSPFHLIPASAIEFAPYNGTLFPPLDEFGGIFNSNPLANEEAFTGTFDDKPTGSWVQIRINLLGIVQAGDTIQLRFDFGIDDCGGAIGWYVDEVEVYSCEAELPPSNCGNGVINGNEECDDGNDFIGDGCSNTCDVDEGWLCSDPTPPGDIDDSGFEDGTPNSSWIEVSNNPFGSPICEAAECNTGGGTGASDGTFWAWFGGITPYQEGSLSQSIVVPSTVSQLTFDLEVPVCDSASDYVEVLIDGNQELLIDGADPRCGLIGYTSQSVDISAYADDLSHNLEFHSETFSGNGGVSNFFIDVIAMPGSPSFCQQAPTTLRLFKQVINDDGGTAFASAWTLTATGPTPFSGNGPAVFSGEGFLPGTYDLLESGGPAGYSTSDWVCTGGSQVDGDTITLAQDEVAICTITNDDIAATLTVQKNIVNDSGGSINDPDAFGLKIDGLAVLHNAANIVDVGDHTVSEIGLPGYLAGTWGGDCFSDGSIALSLGQNATCSISNDDVSPTLTVVKTIVNDNGGTVTDPDAFGLNVDGGGVLHNVITAVDAGTRVVSEDGLPGYLPGTWGGDCNPDGSIMLALDQHSTCSITNDDGEPSLTLVKQVINDHGGSATASVWTLTATGAAGFSGSGPSVSNGPGFLAGIYDLAESGGVAGYNASGWVCVGGNQLDSDTISLGPGDVATCTIINDDVAPTLTLVKTIVNDNGGTITDPNAFGLKFDGGAVLHNISNPVSAGNHTASEVGLAGYQPGVWGGDCNADGSITLALEQDAICTISNDDISPTLTVVKTIVNDNGGTVTDPDAFDLKIDGIAVLDSMANIIDAGEHTVAEIGLDDYQAGVWAGDCNPDGSITLGLAQEATCMITNDDIAPTLTLIKTIVNDNGGTIHDEDAFGLKIDGIGVLNNVINETDIGIHTASEDGLPGYQAGAWGGDCNPDGSITLALNQDAICTISNNDITPTLTVLKTIISDNGGTVTDRDDFGLRVDGGIVLHGTTNVFDAGNHTVSEDGMPGYDAGTWGGDCNPDGSITLALAQEATCTITNDDSNATSLTLIKEVINNNGGTASESEWTLTADGPGGFSGSGPFVTSGSDLAVGIYDLSESGGPSGYSAGPWVCQGGNQIDEDTIELTVGEIASCTIINNDIFPTLTLINTVINDSGGTVIDPDAFGLKVNGVGLGHDVTTPIFPGSHTVSETGIPGYQPGSWGGDCDPDGSITMSLGEDAICTITNNDISPILTVVKTPINDNGGTTTDPNAFGLRIDGSPVQDSTATAVNAGNHTVSEVGLPGYLPGIWVGDCNSDGTITLVLDQDATCTITNDDIADTSLTLLKQVINDNGGDALGSDWTLTADGPSGFSGTGPNVSNEPDFSAGIYDLSESGGVPGYDASSWACVGGSQDDGDTITLALGDVATCTITNDDTDTTSLTLVKEVVNNHGGTAPSSAWTLTASGPTPFSGSGPSVSNGPGFYAGTYILSESGGPPGYSASAWDCVGGTQDDGVTISLALGDVATCTLTNSDIAPTLTVFKTIVNDNGGAVTDLDAFGLRIDGGAVLHNVATVLDIGSHTVSEDGLAGYQAGIWGGDCNPDGTITLALDQDAICTVTNDDITPTLTVVKTIINDNGGTISDEDAFGLKVDGAMVLHNVTNAFDAGNHSLSEDGLPGYDPGTWGGACNPDGSITLALDQDATCTLTNDDTDSTSLTLIKEVINDHGGSAPESAWTLTASGPTPISGSGPSVSSDTSFSAGSYDLSESGGPDGYTASDWVCVGGTQDDPDTITLGLGDVATCTITNNDITPTLKVVKTIINNNGGTITDENAFDLKVDDSTVLHNVTNTVDAGNRVVSEEGLPGYEAGNWGGDCSPDGSITLVPDQDATCTITNDDAAPGLTLVKEVINNYGGLAQPSAWTLTAIGPTSFGGAGPSVSNGTGFKSGSYVLSESGGPEGYTASEWVCDDGTQDGADIIILALGESATCTITNNDISPTLTVVNTILNDSGGMVTDPDAFGLKVDGGSVLNNAANSFGVGNHTVSQDGLPGYWSGNWGGDCNPDGSITLALDQDAICTISNNDVSPSLRVNKTIINDNGGLVTDPNAFGLKVDSDVVLHNAINSYDAGDHIVSESGGPPGYQAGNWGGDCNSDGTITLVLGQAATCTLTNDDAAPGLTLIKEVINNNGGTALPSDWTLTATGPTGFSGSGPSISNGTGFEIGSYDLSESNGPDGYSASTWVCDGGSQDDANTITLALGEAATCTITNDDITPTVRVVKIIVNDNGGTITDENAFGLKVDGITVSHNAATAFNAGSHTLSESGLPGYQAGAWGGNCNPDGSITLALGQDATCTLTNNDAEPSLTLIKEVINNNGGTTPASAWTLTASGPTSFSGAGPSVSHGSGFEAGSYDLSESGGSVGYTTSDWVCVGGTQNDSDTITLGLGESATCTITNDDDAPALTLVKEITNNNGGTALPSAWTLSATGPTSFSGAGPSVTNGASFDIGSYDLTESGGPDGYSASAWICVGGTQDDADTITLALGEAAICTISNNDIAPTLTVVKTIVNDNGGTVIDENAFGLRVDDGVVLHNTTNAFDAGNHTVSEGGLPGYQAGAWGGDCSPDGSINLELAQDATCTLANNDAAPGLTLIKEVINNNGGTALPSDWTLTATGPTGFSGSGPSVPNGTGFEIGSYDLSESNGPDGYSASTWVCDGGSQDDADTITLALGETATCTITNDDISPTLTVVKSIINDNGGTIIDENSFGLKVDGNVVLNNATNAFDAGSHSVSESGLPGYQAGAWGGNCNPDGSITLALGQDATCTLTNNDAEPSLTLIKEVINNNGGTTPASAWTLTASGPTSFSGAGPSVSHGSGFEAGSYDLSESGGSVGYTTSDWVCVGGTQNDSDTITLGLGESATCTITNDDDAPALTLVKEITNNNGGTALPSAWTLSATGPTSFSGAGPSVTNGASFDIGSYDLTESGGPDGYSASAWICVGGTQDDADTITLALGEAAICTISNNDIAPTLTVVKTIVNDNGGTVIDENAFGLRVDDGVVLHNTTNAFDAGNHTVSEGGLPGYQAGAWGGDCSPDGSINLELAQDATCTLANNDAAPGLTLIKEVINNNGGTALPSDWTLTATGPTGFSGSGPSVPNGTGFEIGSYDLSESNGPDGYSASTWVCDGGSQDDADTITLALGETATCTITNDDISPTLTVVKSIINDNGGTIIDENSFGLKVDGNVVLNNATNAFDAGSHSVSESGLPGYQAGAWGGNCNPDGSITLALGQDATCTLTNNDAEPSLTLIKEVINNNGGTSLPSAWTLTATGPASFSGAGPSVSNGADFQAGSYDLSESGGPDNYSASAWSCVGGTQDDADTITLAPGDTATCTITNDDLKPGLTLFKEVLNNNGGTEQASAWTLTATGPTGFSGSGPSVSSDDGFEAGTYDLSESGGPDGYNPSEWVCVGGTQDDADTITLALGEAVACTIRNDDDEPGLTLVKEVSNDNGGIAVPSNWTLIATGPSGFSGAGPSVSNGAGFEAGSYDLSESGGPDGYTASDWVCVGGTQTDTDTINLALGESATCTLSNDDDEPGLTLIKEVTNNNGGTASPTAWTLTAVGPTGFNGAGPEVSNGADFEAGSYDLSENVGPDGYKASDWICIGGTQVDADTITLALGETATCTITNDDEGPGLTLIKKVINNFEGPAVPSDWTLTAIGPTGFSGPGPTVPNEEGFESGTYDLSESGSLEGYTASDWECVGGTQDDADTITLALGEAATCTITNEDTGYDPRIFVDGFE